MKEQIVQTVTRCDVCGNTIGIGMVCSLHIEHMYFDVCSVCQSKVTPVLEFLTVCVGMDFEWEWN